MDLSPIHDARSVGTAQDLGFAKFHLHRPHSFTCNNQLASLLQITAAFLPVHAFAPPAARSNCKTSTRTILSRTRRLKRRKTRSGDSGDVEGYGFFGGDDGYGGFGGGPGGDGGGNWGGRGWNFDGFGGQDWDESSPSWSSPALYFIYYEVIGWIALSNCVHFAFKKMVRSLTAGIGDAEREKAPISSIC